MPVTAARGGPRSLAELTLACFGEALTMDEVFARVALVEIPSSAESSSGPKLWVGSVGYESHKDHRAFARHLINAGVQRLVDVRELPVSRRRGYAKTALAQAMTEVGIEYVHVKALGNPKRFRDLYKSGRVDEGRRCYERYLLSEGMEALRDLIPLLRGKRSALMCVEHDSAACHRAVIVDALQEKLGLDLDVTEIG